jgi:hypothetical protein
MKLIGIVAHCPALNPWCKHTEIFLEKSAMSD